SYAFIHKRNLVNEAIPHLVLADPEFHAAVTDNAEITVDLAKGQVTVAGRTWQAQAPTAIAAGLQAAGGIVPAILAHGPQVFEKLTA
ncbi:MAG: 3-isopropylmalate dehydratase, partial [Myxococcales bacterium]|nr:3-isopropylmalate dehydratase [Myxococcales bacterium]